jgi:hypothetical protein
MPVYFDMGPSAWERVAAQKKRRKRSAADRKRARAARKSRKRNR